MAAAVKATDTFRPVLTTASKYPEPTVLFREVTEEHRRRDIRTRNDDEEASGSFSQGDESVLSG